MFVENSLNYLIVLCAYEMGDKPIYKEHFGTLGVSAWPDSLAIQKRAMKDKSGDRTDPDNYMTVGEIKGVNKTQALELAKMLRSAAADMSEPKPFKGKK